MDIEVEYLPLSEIVQADINPKDHDIGAIYQSIKRFGFTQPIMMNEKTGKLLAGHGRLQTLQTLKDAGEKVPNRIKEKDGEWLVPVLKGISFEDDNEAQAYQTLKDAGEKVPNRIKEKDGEWLVPVLKGIAFEDDNEAQAYLIADNRLTELGGWNTGELVEELERLIESGLDLDGIGYDFDDLETMVSDMESRFEVEDIPDVDDEETDVKIQIGRYRFKVDPELFYEWESRVADELGSRDSDEFVDWLRETLGI